AGGQYIWQNTKTWDSTSSDDWTQVFDQGTDNMSVAVDSQDGVVYSAWCGTVNCNSAGFTRGVATNYGSKGWHQLDVSALPNRYPAGITVDPNDPTGATVYVAFNGFNRRFIEGPGSGIPGHVFKGHLNAKGDVTWTDVSGNLPDIPTSAIVVLDKGHLVLGTDLGVLESTDDGAHWKRVTTSSWTPGQSLPVSTVNDLHVSGNGSLYVATYGRGLWQIPLAKLG
ncbi:MAG TPA: glycosyl hydrolase, partial [Actinomycetes bacterium]|nr:glycosyl hydrolase [Actinomycetes bacterium]